MVRQELNDVMENLGLGSYQVYTMLLLAGIVVQDGSEMLLLSALIRSMATEFGADPVVRGMAVSVVFVGMLLGGLMSGVIGDRCGRRLTSIGAYMFTCFFGLSCTLAWSMSVVIVLRFFMGIGVGIGVPATTTLMVEILPTKTRAIVYSGAWNLMFVLGQMWAAIGLMIFMPDLKGSQWRTLCIWSAAPSLVLLPFCFLYLKESPRWLMVNRRKDELESLLRYAALCNGHPNLDTTLDESICDPEEQTEALRGARGSDAAPDDDSDSDTDLSVVRRLQMCFNSENARTTLICSFLCMVCNFMFYGQSYAFTQEFRTEKNDWVLPATELLLTSIFTLPGTALASWFILSNIGNCQSMSFCAASTAALSIFMIAGDYSHPLVYDGSCYMYVLFNTALFNIVYVYVPEAYPSVIRQTGVSMCMSVGRLGSIVAPVIFEVLWSEFNKSHVPFLLLIAAMGFMGSFLARFLTLETKGLRLAEFTSQEMREEQKLGLEDDKMKEAPGEGECQPLLSSKI